MSHHVVEFDCKCEACGATGLCEGLYNREGVAIVCGACKGTGKNHRVIRYDDFEGRERLEGIDLVLEVDPDIIIGQGKGHCDDLGGMSYEQWLNGRPFQIGMEMRKFTCPLQWAHVIGDQEPKWKECIKSGAFKRCNHYKGKAKCWAKWDKERQAAIEARNQVTDETPKGTKPA